MNRGVEVPAARLTDGHGCHGLPCLSHLFLTTYSVLLTRLSGPNTVHLLLDAAEAVWVLTAPVSFQGHLQTGKR